MAASVKKGNAVREGVAQQIILAAKKRAPMKQSVVRRRAAQAANVANLTPLP